MFSLCMIVKNEEKNLKYCLSKVIDFVDEIIIVDTDFYKYNVDEFINNSSNEKKVGRIQRINIMEDSNGNKKYIERVNRLFNRNYFHYEGIIHEQIVALDGKPYETEIVDITAEI